MRLTECSPIKIIFAFKIHIIGVLRFVDTIWAKGELFHMREKTPGDGCTLLMWCWYFDVAIPIFSLARQLNLKCFLDLIFLIFLLAAPFVFCRLRYTPAKRKEILENQVNKHLSRKLLFIWTIIIGAACVEGMLMLHFGIWTAGTCL